MRLARIHHGGALVSGEEVTLDERASRHLSKVLRLGAGDPCILFNGTGGESVATLIHPDPQAARARVADHDPVDRESPLHVTLAQGISRGERMDYTLQKSVELGVAAIQPLFAERTQVKLTGERLDKRMAHWRGVILSACEQSGRTRVPPLHPARSLDDWLAQPRSGTGLLLDQRAQTGLGRLDLSGPLTLLIGPEGGLSEAERRRARECGFNGVRMGPRVLRTETASLAALSTLQALHGDW